MKIVKSLLSLLLIVLISSATNHSAQASNKKACQRIVVSDNRRYLQYEDGTPFFYLGDTAWELFHKLDRKEADHYLKDRADKGFNVIQAVALAELDGPTVPNAYGHLPFENKDPSKPQIRSGENNDYWDHVDYIVKKANSLGMVIALLPTWGSYWHDSGKSIFNEKNASEYGQFLGERYKDSQVIWVLGGDRVPENDQQKAIIRAMAKGLKAGDGGRHLCTFHPTGGLSSSNYFHKDEWLDFNMRQNGHEVEYGRYEKTLDDYRREPVKPVIDAEPVYEDHPVSFNAKQWGHSISVDCRHALYWNLFNGAFGHTYGHHSIWQMYDPSKNQGINNPLLSWKEALQQPGSRQMKHARWLMESRPFFTRIPATDRVLVKSNIPTAMPGQGRYRFVATCDTDGTYAMVYVPAGRTFSVNMDVIKSEKVKAWWYNPRNGKARKIGVFSNKGTQTFETPAPGEMLDWVLVLDSSDKNYKIPKADV